jgi:pimeloyl-ACP methyl ester carboxylesterase
MGRLRQFVRDGLTFDVRDEGPVDGATVLLLHGFPQGATAWDDVVPALHEAGLRTLVPDQRGYSPGARPGGRSAYRIGEAVDDALALLDAAGVSRAHLVGHDWGGTVAWALAGRCSDRLVSAVVLSTPHPEAMAWAIRHSDQGFRSAYLGLYQLPWVAERVIAGRLEGRLRRGGLPEPATARYVRLMADPGALAGALAWYRALPFTLREHFPPSRVPTTYAWGRHDPYFSRAAAERTRPAVSAPYRFVELDAGHWLPETRPVPVATVLLDQVRAVAQT